MSHSAAERGGRPPTYAFRQPYTCQIHGHKRVSHEQHLGDGSSDTATVKSHVAVAAARFADRMLPEAFTSDRSPLTRFSREPNQRVISLATLAGESVTCCESSLESNPNLSFDQAITTWRASMMSSTAVDLEEFLESSEGWEWTLHKADDRELQRQIDLLDEMRLVHNSARRCERSQPARVSRRSRNAMHTLMPCGAYGNFVGNLGEYLRPVSCQQKQSRRNVGRSPDRPSRTYTMVAWAYSLLL